MSTISAKQQRNNPFVLAENERKLAHKFLTLQQKGNFPKPIR
jgi:hypothetical protein